MMPRSSERPKLVLTNVNSPSVRPGRDRRLQPAVGADVRLPDHRRPEPRRADGADPRGQGRAQQRPGSAPEREINGVMLVGRGAGARGARVAPGRATAAHVRWRLEGTPRMAITGNAFLVRDGKIKAVDDREMHPRTAIGIDRDAKTLLFLVVDGRQKFSRGYTMVELAKKMIELGADEALNLDGGGSSTMMAKGRGGLLKVINSPVRRVPALGRQRHRDHATRSRADLAAGSRRSRCWSIGAKHSCFGSAILSGAHLRTGPSPSVMLTPSRYVAADRHRRGREPALGVARVRHRLLDRSGHVVAVLERLHVRVHLLAVVDVVRRRRHLPAGRGEHQHLHQLGLGASEDGSASRRRRRRSRPGPRPRSSRNMPRSSLIVVGRYRPGEGSLSGVRQASVMARFTRAELESFRGAEVPDLLGPGPAAALRRHQPRAVDRGHPDPLRAPGQPLLPRAAARRGDHRADLAVRRDTCALFRFGSSSDTGGAAPVMSPSRPARFRPRGGERAPRRRCRSAARCGSRTCEGTSSGETPPSRSEARCGSARASRRSRTAQAATA